MSVVCEVLAVQYVPRKQVLNAQLSPFPSAFMALPISHLHHVQR